MSNLDNFSSFNLENNLENKEFKLLILNNNTINIFKPFQGYIMEKVEIYNNFTDLMYNDDNIINNFNEYKHLFY